jgi:hypothetical protein
LSVVHAEHLRLICRGVRSAIELAVFCIESFLRILKEFFSKKFLERGHGGSAPVLRTLAAELAAGGVYIGAEPPAQGGSDSPALEYCGKGARVGGPGAGVYLLAAINLVLRDEIYMYRHGSVCPQAGVEQVSEFICIVGAVV